MKSPDVVAKAVKLVLPGVGAFRDAIARLRESGLADPIVRHVESGRPFLGICLGLQLLFTRSHEDGVHSGLDVLPGEVVRFPTPTVPGLKVPHMGWNTLRLRPECPLFRGLPQESAVYFVHSYTAEPQREEDRLADADYGGCRIAGAIRRGNVIGCQFHPEKSGQVGLAMLAEFLRR